MEKIKLTKKEYLGEGITLNANEGTIKEGTYSVVVEEDNLLRYIEMSEDEFNQKYLWL